MFIPLDRKGKISFCISHFTHVQTTKITIDTQCINPFFCPNSLPPPLSPPSPLHTPATQGKQRTDKGPSSPCTTTTDCFLSPSRSMLRAKRIVLNIFYHIYWGCPWSIKKLVHQNAQKSLYIGSVLTSLQNKTRELSSKMTLL